MTNGSSAFLVDTNVLVYAYDPSDPAKYQRAIAVVDELSAHGTGALSAQVLGEFFVTVTRKIPLPLTLAEAETTLTNYARTWTIYPLTDMVVLEAVRGVQRHQMSYWDSLIWATAKLNGIANVLSEDFRDGALVEGVRFLNPLAPAFDLAVLGASL